MQHGTTEWVSESVSQWQSSFSYKISFPAAFVKVFLHRNLVFDKKAVSGDSRWYLCDRDTWQKIKKTDTPCTWIDWHCPYNALSLGGTGDQDGLDDSLWIWRSYRFDPRQHKIVQLPQQWLKHPQTSSWSFSSLFTISCLSNETLNRGPESIAWLVPAR